MADQISCAWSDSIKQQPTGPQLSTALSTIASVGATGTNL